MANFYLKRGKIYGFFGDLSEKNVYSITIRAPFFWVRIIMGIQAENIQLSLGQRTILHNVSLTVPKGQSLVLMGQSGVGKSVLLRCILGLLPRQKGLVHIDQYHTTPESPVSNSSFFDKAGVVFQSYALFDSLTVWENIAFRVHGSVSMRRKRAARLLDQVELSAKTMDLYPSALSGGMKRRVSIARAMALDPTYLFFDEPTEGLDPILSNTVALLIRKVITQLKATAITISHNIHNAVQIGDQIALLDEGGLVWQGKTDALQHTLHPLMRQFVACSFSENSSTKKKTP
jgi:phospholipid/cholesterol/gamma-HCH transport system ATP-binding protein